MGEGSGTLVSGNTVNGASDVGITGVYAKDFTAENNTVSNVNMNRSPWGNQSHVGMMVEHDAGSVTYQNNAISNCGDGLAFSGGSKLTFENNHITDCLRGLYGNGANTLMLTGCSFNNIATTPQTKNMFGALRLAQEVGSAVITGCSFTNIGPYIQGAALVQLLSEYGTLSGNTIHTDNGKYKAISAPSSWTIGENTILP
jgi:parallel beta-helix repeat protein